MRDVRPSLIARVKVGLHNHGSEKTASRDSSTFSLMGKMYVRIPKHVA